MQIWSCDRATSRRGIDFWTWRESITRNSISWNFVNFGKYFVMPFQAVEILLAFNYLCPMMCGNVSKKLLQGAVFFASVYVHLEITAYAC